MTFPGGRRKKRRFSRQRKGNIRRMWSGGGALIRAPTRRGNEPISLRYDGQSRHAVSVWGKASGWQGRSRDVCLARRTSGEDLRGSVHRRREAGRVQ